MHAKIVLNIELSGRFLLIPTLIPASGDDEEPFGTCKSPFSEDDSDDANDADSSKNCT